MDMITAKLRVDGMGMCLKIEYVIDVEMSPMRITNDSSLFFYMELKRKDPRITAYPLRVDVCVLN